MAYYEDDLFHPTNTNEDLISIGSGGRKKVNRLLSKMNGGDNSYFQISKLVDVRINGQMMKKRRNIAFYASGPHGTNIRHAITGEFYKGHTVGSKSEYLYFKVGLGCGITGLSNDQSPFTLFYDSHNEWSNHMQENISDKDKEKWEKRNKKARESLVVVKE